MSEDRSVSQIAIGSYIAQAAPGGTATVNVYEYARPGSVDKELLIRAGERLAEMPLDEIPEPAPLPPASRMPFGRNPLFVGRRQDLRKLSAMVQAGRASTGSRLIILVGLGGIGKTQLAVEFAHRYGQYFAGGVYYLNFSESEAIPAEVAACGDAHGGDIPHDFSSLSFGDQLRMVLASWQSPLPRLLIFDNCHDEAILNTWFPAIGGCHVLVTSRRAQWNATLGAQIRQLGVLSRPESISLLSGYELALSGDDDCTDAIAAELGDLPLALHLAGSFLARYRHLMRPSTYLAQLKDPAVLGHQSLQLEGVSPTGHIHHVARTFAISYERLDSDDLTDSLALTLLARAACFCPGEPLPRELLRKTAPLSPQDPDALVQVEDALIRILELGLMDGDPSGSLLMHRLLSVFIQARMSDAEPQIAVETTVLKHARQLNRGGRFKQLLAWHQHLRAVTDTARPRGDRRAADLCNELAYHLWSIGDYAGAQFYYQEALAIYETKLGASHPNLISYLDNLGAIRQVQGDLHGAQDYYERALTLSQEKYGERHLETVRILSNLASLYQAKGDFPKARSAYERVLAVRVDELGENHQETAICLNNLGTLLQAIGDHAGACDYLERALGIYQAQPGGDRSFGLTVCLNNLGDLYHTRGEWQTARAHYQQALAIRETILVKDHPDIAESLNNLAGLLYDRGDYSEARPHMERALDILQASLGPDHPRTRMIRENLNALNEKEDRKDDGEH